MIELFCSNEVDAFVFENTSRVVAYELGNRKALYSWQ